MTQEGGIAVEASDWMQLFLETGAPEYYLFYKEALRAQTETTG